jgi:hypothetical protein
VADGAGGAGGIIKNNSRAETLRRRENQERRFKNLFDSSDVAKVESQTTK